MSYPAPQCTTCGFPYHATSVCREHIVTHQNQYAVPNGWWSHDNLGFQNEDIDETSDTLPFIKERNFKVDTSPFTRGFGIGRSHGPYPVAVPANQATQANDVDPRFGDNPAPAAEALPASASLIREPRNFKARGIKSQIGPHCDSSAAATKELFCAHCLFPGCEHVMYSTKRSKAKDNLLQHHQKKGQKHKLWMCQLANKSDRCRVSTRLLAEPPRETHH
ncbi:hypothetical protein AOL_s00169g150 [Orbilia oligospora ATCC 24927]|uniref:C2H2-type domain-containing protein n=1 Tax=Arthrobotrys oligospora (strain ATCC 24927 / CBS 115.81 / DSM 1491) TaxID=756982 RepID=G1XMU7_ARTOA|nr:hypothetical protein AOL_s00169g150 [Orbilia oligospora ATCC 24927]EGX45544.1 hypothetical protein AOL_s00169g150 [Orbilia oligospora ATCC 24927]